MDVVCADKTGTLDRKWMRVCEVEPDGSTWRRRCAGRPGRRRPSQREHAGNRRGLSLPPGWVVAANAPFAGHQVERRPFAITVVHWVIGASDAALSGCGARGRADRSAGIAGAAAGCCGSSIMPKPGRITLVALVVLEQKMRARRP